MTVLFLTLALAAQQSHATRSADVPADARAAIARANEEWLPAMKKQDARAIVEPYADDAVFVLPSGDSVKGRAAIEELMRSRFSTAGRVESGTLQQDDLVVVGSMIYEWGHADLEMAGARGGPPSHATGRYLTVWKRDSSGRWRIIRNLSFAD